MSKGKKKSARKSSSIRGRAAGRRSLGARNGWAQAGSCTDVVSALKLAERYLSTGQEARVAELLTPFGSQYPFGDPALAAAFDRLLAFGYAHVNRLAEAEVIIERALAQSGNTPDLYYLQSYVRLSLRDYDGTILAGQRYLQLREQRSADSAGFTLSSGHLGQLYNFLGAAYREKQMYDCAAEHFTKSIASDPGNHLPYLNLTNLFLHLKDHKAATEIVENGLKSCRQIQELRMLDEAIQNRATVSACMIAKNEEEQLERCLKSIREWVDEIVIVDTGSTDRTVDIARAYGARIFHQPWEGDFSKHRNYSLEQATGDWCFVIDADEEFCLDDLNHLRELLNQPDCKAISINVYNLYPNERTTTFLPSIRFFRSNLKLRYEGIVHNNLQLPQDQLVHRARVRLNHYGYDLSPEKMKAKAARTKALLEKQLAENPDNAFALFNYAQVLRGEGDAAREDNAPMILRSAERAVLLTDPSKPAERAIHLMCLDQLAWTYFYVKDHDRAVEFAQKALTIKANYLDPMLLLGHVYARQSKFEQASEWYNKYLDAQAEYIDATESDNIILIHIDSRATAYYALAAIAEMLGRTGQAKHYYRLTLSLNPHHLDANLALGRLLLNEGNLVEAEALFAAHLRESSDSVEALLGLGYIAFQRNDFAASREHYRRVVKLRPSNAIALLKLGEIELQAGYDDEAAEYFQSALDAGSSDDSVERRLADIYFNGGRYAEAAECYDHLLSRTVPSSGLYNDLGNCYFRLNRLDMAEQYYLKAVATNPVTGVAYRNLGVTLARLGRADAALKELEKYFGIPEAQIEVHQLVADLCLQGGKFRKAIEHYEEYLAKHPTDINALFGLSECYLQLGHRDSAILGYRRILQISPGYAPADDKLNQLVGMETEVRA